MVYNTGSRDDWNHISRITDDPAWTWEAMAPYRDLSQRYVPPNDGHDDVSRNQLSPPLTVLSTPLDEPIPPVGTQSERDGTHQPCWVPMATYRFESCRGHHRTGFSVRVSLPAGHEHRRHGTFHYDRLSGLPLITFRSGKQIGFGWVQATIGNGQRSSSATSYVGPDYINRPNLHILLHAQATKLLEATGRGITIPTFNGVEFGTESSGKSMIP